MRSGAPQSEARIVAEALVRADMMGMPSHGVLRVVQYVKDAQEKSILERGEKGEQKCRTSLVAFSTGPAIWLFLFYRCAMILLG